MTKVIVADDQNISRSFFELYVRSAANYELIAGLRTAEDAVKYVEAHEVDLLILDVLMRQGIDGLTAAEQIKRRHPDVKIIITTSAAETGWEKKARSAGVEGFWYKEYDENSLIEIMDRVMAGETVYPGDPPKVDFGKTNRKSLTDRELDVLRELTHGFSNREIAAHLNIADTTVKRHIENILIKTGYTNRLELAVNAKFLGVVVHDEDRTSRRNDEESEN